MVKKGRLLCVSSCAFVLCVWLSGMSPQSMAVPHGALPKPPIDDPVTPVNEPDKFAWQLFAYVNSKAPLQSKVTAGGNQVNTNNALWETWANDPETFPQSPDPLHPPQWPAGPNALARGAGKTLRPRSKVEAVRSRFQSPHFDLVQAGGGEEVARNKPAFDFIIQNNLWYTQGLAAAFKAGKKISFPTDAIEIKANWIPITPDQKAQYHWNYDAKGNLYGLVAMHITSKVLPNWFWATFEWVGNKGRSDYIGSRDTFGVIYDDPADPTFQKPNSTPGQVYPPGTITPALLDLFKTAGFNGEWTQEWKNYRLKGSQIDFTDATGLPTLLGNSITEEGFVPTSSCITCHSRAAVTATGQDAFPVAGFKPLLTGDSNVESYNGSPDPNWFWKITTFSPPQLTNLQTDFLWAMPFNAQPVKK